MTVIPMTRQSPIVKVEHDRESTMRLTWHGGNVYEYTNVRMNDAVDLAWSEHPVKFFNERFRKHECRKIGGGVLYGSEATA